MAAKQVKQVVGNTNKLGMGESYGQLKSHLVPYPLKSGGGNFWELLYLQELRNFSFSGESYAASYTFRGLYQF